MSITINNTLLSIVFLLFVFSSKIMAQKKDTSDVISIEENDIFENMPIFEEPSIPSPTPIVIEGEHIIISKETRGFFYIIFVPENNDCTFAINLSTHYISVRIPRSGVKYDCGQKEHQKALDQGKVVFLYKYPKDDVIKPDLALKSYQFNEYKKIKNLLAGNSSNIDLIFDLDDVVICPLGIGPNHVDEVERILGEKVDYGLEISCFQRATVREIFEIKDADIWRLK